MTKRLAVILQGVLKPEGYLATPQNDNSGGLGFGGLNSALPPPPPEKCRKLAFCLKMAQWSIFFKVDPHISRSPNSMANLVGSHVTVICHCSLQKVSRLQKF